MKKKLLRILLILSLIASMFILTACGENKKDESKENKKESSSKSKEVEVKDDGEKVIDESVASLSELEISTFNQQFEIYSGRNLGSEVTSLLNKINSNNISESSTSSLKSKIVSVKYIDENGETQTVSGSNMNELSKFKTTIKSKHYYTIEVEKNSDGCVNCVVIKY